jgi:hypothetical protein
MFGGRTAKRKSAVLFTFEGDYKEAFNGLYEYDIDEKVWSNRTAYDEIAGINGVYGTHKMIFNDIVRPGGRSDCFSEFNKLKNFLIIFGGQGIGRNSDDFGALSGTTYSFNIRFMDL